MAHLQISARSVHRCLAILACLSLTSCEDLNEASLGSPSTDIALEVVTHSFDPELDAAIPDNPDDFIGECEALKSKVNLRFRPEGANAAVQIAQEDIEVDVNVGDKIRCRYTGSTGDIQGNLEFTASIDPQQIGADLIPAWQASCDMNVMPPASEHFNHGWWVHFRSDRFVDTTAHQNCCKKQDEANDPGPPGFPPNCN